MIKFKYSLISQIIYRWMNIPISLLLILQIYVSVFNITHNLYLIIPLLINITILYYLNKFYMFTYSHFPFEIIASNEKLICRNFFDKSKELIIYNKDIIEIKGGLFSGNLARPIYISDGKNIIGFHSHLKDSNKLLTIILSNISKELYDSLLDKMKIKQENFQDKSSNRKKKKSNSKKN